MSASAAVPILESNIGCQPEPVIYIFMNRLRLDKPVSGLDDSLGELFVVTAIDHEEHSRGELDFRNQLVDRLVVAQVQSLWLEGNNVHWVLWPKLDTLARHPGLADITRVD
jgi:hypothetical protein